MASCSICHDLQVNSPLGQSPLSGGVSFSELIRAADSGCSACAMLRDGTISFEEPDEVVQITAVSRTETRRDSRMGQRLPLHVTIESQRGMKAQYDFYCVDRKFLCHEVQGPVKPKSDLTYLSTSDDFVVADSNSIPHLPRFFNCRMLQTSTGMVRQLPPNSFSELWPKLLSTTSHTSP
jgi:hypothetical protein